MASELESIEQALRASRDKVEGIVKVAKTEGRALNETEEALLAEERSHEDALLQQLDIVREERERRARAAETVAAIRQADDALADPDGDDSGGPRVRKVASGEPDMYRRGGEHSFLTDWAASRPHAPNSSSAFGGEARERIGRYAEEMKQRDRTSANFAGLVVPQYLTSEADTSVRSLRPTADAMPSRPLPQTGMTFNIPQVTTAFTAGFAAENAASAEADGVVTDLQINLKTVRGAAEISYESIHRGVMIEDLLLRELSEAIAQQVNAAVLGTVSGINGLFSDASLVSGNKLDQDDTSPTAAEHYALIIDMLSKLAETRFRPATHIVMHPRRLGFLAKALDGDSRPIFQASAMTAMNPTLVGAPISYGNTGIAIAGVPIISDAGVPTTKGGGTEDMIGAFHSPDCLLYEGPLMMMEGDPQLVNWNHSLVVGCYIGFSFRHKVSATTLTGTTLIAPT